MYLWNTTPVSNPVKSVLKSCISVSKRRISVTSIMDKACVKTRQKNVKLYKNSTCFTQDFVCNTPIETCTLYVLLPPHSFEPENRQHLRKSLMKRQQPRQYQLHHNSVPFFFIFARQPDDVPVLQIALDADNPA